MSPKEGPPIYSHLFGGGRPGDDLADPIFYTGRKLGNWAPGGQPGRKVLRKLYPMIIWTKLGHALARFHAGLILLLRLAPFRLSHVSITCQIKAALLRERSLSAPTETQQ